MTLKYTDDDIEQIVNAQLDAANSTLPSDRLRDLHNARMQALRSDHSNGFTSIVRLWHRGKDAINMAVAVPSFAVVAMVLLISYGQGESVPALPLDFMATDLPTEDILLLEDLEFATWLVEQEYGATN